MVSGLFPGHKTATDSHPASDGRTLSRLLGRAPRRSAAGVEGYILRRNPESAGLLDPAVLAAVPAGESVPWAQAVQRAGSVMLAEVRTQGAAVDAGIWADWAVATDAARALRAAIDRGHLTLQRP